MSDNIGVIWGKFFSHRTRVLWERFPGCYRALVVETNDPLNMYRVRFKCPDMHDFDLKAEDCPWAVPAHDLGGKRAGRFSHPCIGDWIWITFERQHPYAPVWTGFANPTRRKLYSYPQIFNISPVSVNDQGKPQDRPSDYDQKYLPQDGRPMMHGWQDRYGNLDIHSSIGFYPDEHKTKPPPPDYDALQKAAFDQKQRQPQVNKPDKKYIARVTKYGNMMVMGDQGYYWKDDGGQLGEFTGNAAADEKFEVKRWKYIQRLLNEDVPNSASKDGDQRRLGLLTRYGHRIECRDVGWAQLGPMESQSRNGEYGPPRTLSTEKVNDYRWIKIRTKGGMLFQAYDKGFDPQNDKFIKRKLIVEQGSKSEKEDKYWKNKDARWMRLVTRYGLKIVLDDRGSDKINATNKETPRGNGILVKGRRSPASKMIEARGNSRGFYWEFNENDAANHTMWGSPMGLVAEMNDRYQYMILSASMGKKWVRKWQGIKENEFIRKPAMIADPEKNSHHLKLDHDNEYVRLKTRGNKGKKPQKGANKSGVGKQEINQGFEARDGKNGDGPWVELVDCQRRGMWFSKKHRLGIWRARKKRRMFMWMDERNQQINIFSGDKRGEVVIYASANVKIIANRNIHMSADGSIFMKAGRTIRMQAGSTKFTLANNILTNKAINALRVNAFLTGAFPGPGAGRPNPSGAEVDRLEVPELPELREPTDRGKTYNEPFEECPKEEVEHKI